MTAPAILRSDPDLTQSLEPFQERLAETVSWCRRRVARGLPAESLRSIALVPPPALPWIDTVHAVAEARLRQLGRSWGRALEPLGGGVLLVYFPGEPHSAGAARLASEDYFDERDLPPWDSWVAWMEEAGRGYLVSWIAPEALAAATAGLKAAGTSLCWLEGSGTALAGRLSPG